MLRRRGATLHIGYVSALDVQCRGSPIRYLHDSAPGISRKPSRTLGRHLQLDSRPAAGRSYALAPTLMNRRSWGASERQKEASVVTEDDRLEGIYVEHHRRDQAGGKRLGQAFLETERARLFGQWIGQGKDLLDLGCRDGTLTRHFREGNRVVGADIDRKALESARTQYGIDVQRVNLNAPLPFPDARFDAAVLGAPSSVMSRSSIISTGAGACCAASASTATPPTASTSRTIR